MDTTINASMSPVQQARKLLRHLLEHGGAVYIEDNFGVEYEGWPLSLTRREVTVQDLFTNELKTVKLEQIAEMVEVDR